MDADVAVGTRVGGRATRVMALLRLLPTRQLIRAEDLAGQLKVSVRTIYRDIAFLCREGYLIDGSTGVGYVISTQRVVPPMALTADEADALVLGLRTVNTWGDPTLAAAAASIYGRLPAALLPHAERSVKRSALVAPYSSYHVEAPALLSVVRRAARDRRRLEIGYTDEADVITIRRVRPLSVAFFAPIWILTAWCELRDDFRSLRIDRMQTAAPLDRFPHEPGRELRDFLG